MCANTGVNLVSTAKQPTLDILMYSLFHFNIKTPNFTNYTYNHKSKYLWFKKRCFGICVCINQIMRFRHVTNNCTLVENFIHKGLSSCIKCDFFIKLICVCIYFCKQDWKWSSILHRFLNIYVAMLRKSIHCPMINQRVLQLFEGFALIWSGDRQEMESSKQKCIINSEVQRFYTI